MKLLQYTLCLTIAFHIVSCDNLAQKSDNRSDIIAEAFGEKLRLDDLSEFLKEARTKSDSQFVISRYSDQWVMDKILYQEAKKTVGKNKDINALVDDYKKSLIIHEWDKLILSQSLDTVVNSEEIDAFYSERKKEFKLQEDIVRFMYVNYPESGNIDELFSDLWKSEDLPALNQFIKQHNGVGFINPENWYYKSELKNLLPNNLFRKISFSKPNNYSLSENETQFFVKIIELGDSDEDAPISFVEEIIKERILHDRAKEILKNKKSTLYEEKIQNKVIKIYSDTDN